MLNSKLDVNIMILIYARSYLLPDVVAPGAMPEVAVVALDSRLPEVSCGCGGGLTIGGGCSAVLVVCGEP
jgi:hypothetical protein